MNILFILIPVSLCLGTGGLLAFLWTLKQGQYKDPVGDAARILNDTFDRAPAPLGLASRAKTADPAPLSAHLTDVT